MAETKRTNTQYVFPVNARFAQGFAWVAQCPTLARERVGCESYSLRHLHLPKPMMGPYGALFSFCFKGV